MADTSATPAPAGPRTAGRAALLTLPMALWALLLFSRAFKSDGRTIGAALVALVFTVALFFLMVKTRATFRWRRVFFVAVGFLFPIGFIAELVAARGSMSIPVEQMIAGNTPFCFLAIPMLVVPAAFARTIIFPGTITASAANHFGIAHMIGLWLAASLVLGKAWCSFGCFFGGLEEGFASLKRRARIRHLSPRWRLVPWAILVAVVLLSAATFEPIYCMWLCPFKTVTEYPEVRSVESAIQAGIFLSLFVGLVVVLPILTKKRTQCSYFCPFGPLQSLTNKLHVFDIRIDQDKCKECHACETVCPNLSLDAGSIAAGRTLLSCMKCGACVDVCKRGAAVWHVKGTSVSARPETARLLFLYAAWAVATMFGGSIIANSLGRLLHFVA